MHLNGNVTLSINQKIYIHISTYFAQIIQWKNLTFQAVIFFQNKIIPEYHEHIAYCMAFR